MTTPDALSPQFVIDVDGRRTAVLLPIDVYEGLLETFRGVHRGEPSEAALHEALRRSGALDDLADPAEDLYTEGDGTPYQP